MHNICNQKWIAARTWIRFKWKWHRNQHQISWLNGWTCYARCMCQCVLLFQAKLWACPIPKWHFMQFNVDTRSDKLTAISPNSILSHVENFNEFHGEKKKIGAIQKTMPPKTNKWNWCSRPRTSSMKHWISAICKCHSLIMCLEFWHVLNNWVFCL